MKHFYTVVHARKGTLVLSALNTYEAAKSAARQWRLKSTSGVDVYLHEEEKVKP